MMYQSMFRLYRFIYSRNMILAEFGQVDELGFVLSDAADAMWAFNYGMRYFCDQEEM